MTQQEHTYTGGLSNRAASDNAGRLYAYLQSIQGRCCLTGQMESTWMGTPDYEMNYIADCTGKLPAIRGLDFIHNDFDGVAQRAREWWENGGIPTICWHTGADFASSYKQSQEDDIDWSEAFTPGSETYDALIAGMDRAVPYLRKLADADVPILWRPFHEMDGVWFWWGKGGSECFKKLWKMMYDRYTDHWGLNNLIWVLGYSGAGKDQMNWYPGDEYVDILGADCYTPGANAELYRVCTEIAPEGMPIVFHECGTIPTERQMKDDGAPWGWFMTWTTDWLTLPEHNTKESLNEIYNNTYFITRDRLPKFF